MNNCILIDLVLLCVGKERQRTYISNFELVFKKLK